MKRLLTYFIYSSVLLLSINAMTFGGIITNDTGANGNTDNIGFEQSDKLVLWFKTPFDFAENSYLVGEGSYKFKYTSIDKGINHYADLSLFKFSTTLPLKESLKLKFDVGRFIVSDLTGSIFNQTTDGLMTSLQGETVKSSLYVGYTGLVNSKNNAMNNQYYTPNDTQFYSLASPYLVTGINASFPRLFANQTLSTEFYGFWDILSVSNDYNRIFYTLSLNGPIKGALFYVFSTSFNMSGSNEVTFGGLANQTSLELSYYPDFKNTMISLKTTVGTGEKGDTIRNFIPISTSNSNLASTLDYAGIVKTGLTCSIRPIESLFCLANTSIFFSLPTDAKKAGVEGFEYLLSARWQALSDVQLTGSFGQYFSIATDDKPYLLGNLKLLIAF